MTRWKSTVGKVTILFFMIPQTCQRYTRRASHLSAAWGSAGRGGFGLCRNVLVATGWSSLSSALPHVSRGVGRWAPQLPSGRRAQKKPLFLLKADPCVLHLLGYFTLPSMFLQARAEAATHSPMGGVDHDLR